LLLGICDGLWLSGTDGLLFLSLCMIDEPRPKASQPGGVVVIAEWRSVACLYDVGAERFAGEIVTLHFELLVASC
jgi:hypothetical protein